jgi:hypothetical protein
MDSDFRMYRVVTAAFWPQEPTTPSWLDTRRKVGFTLFLNQTSSSFYIAWHRSRLWLHNQSRMCLHN